MLFVAFAVWVLFLGGADWLSETFGNVSDEDASSHGAEETADMVRLYTWALLIVGGLWLFFARLLTPPS